MRRGRSKWAGEEVTQTSSQACLSVYYMLGSRDTEMSVRNCQEIGGTHINGELSGTGSALRMDGTGISGNLEKRHQSWLVGQETS